MKKKNRFRKLLESSQNWKKPAWNFYRRFLKPVRLERLTGWPAHERSGDRVCGTPTVCRKERQIGFSPANAHGRPIGFAHKVNPAKSLQPT